MTLAHYVDSAIAQKRQELSMLEEVASILVEAENASDLLIGRIAGLGRFAQAEYPQPVPVQAQPPQQQVHYQQPQQQTAQPQRAVPPGYPPRPAPVYSDEAAPHVRHVPFVKPTVPPEPVAAAHPGWQGQLSGFLQRADGVNKAYGGTQPPPVPTAKAQG